MKGCSRNRSIKKPMQAPNTVPITKTSGMAAVGLQPWRSTSDASTIVVSATDGVNTPVTQTFTLTVTNPAPTALVLTQKVWKPGKINFTLVNSDKGLAKIYVYDIRGGSAVQKCSLKP